MAYRNIVKRGDEVLTKKCRPVENFDKKLHLLLDDMAQTMYKAQGVGLAGPQVGILRRLAVVDVGEGLLELVNPVITEREGEEDGVEGCLSCPDIWGVVNRPTKITVKAYDRNGKEFTITVEDFFARACCHEIDHLDGITIYESARRMISPEEMEELTREK